VSYLLVQRVRSLLAVLALLSSVRVDAGVAMPVSFEDVLALGATAPDRTVAYGGEQSQFASLWLPPQASGPVPVVVLVHGGCWLAEYSLQHIRPLAAAIANAGYAVWAPEYRRVGDGGGWPRTGEDILAAVGFLGTLEEPRLDLERVVLAGHSAGGHLALWAGANLTRLPAALRVRGILGLAAIADLEAYAGESGSCPAATPRLMGGMPQDMPERYRQASPARLQYRVPVALVQGDADPIVPPAQAASVDVARVTMVAGAGHFDLIHPQTPAFGAVSAALRELLR
jgi:acetyl esterase/lipase